MRPGAREIGTKENKSARWILAIECTRRQIRLKLFDWYVCWGRRRRVRDLAAAVLEVDSRSEDEFVAHDLAFLQGAANILAMATPQGDHASGQEQSCDRGEHAQAPGRRCGRSGADAASGGADLSFRLHIAFSPSSLSDLASIEIFKPLNRLNNLASRK
jgi:hypothetical protein